MKMMKRMVLGAAIAALGWRFGGGGCKHAMHGVSAMTRRAFAFI